MARVFLRSLELARTDRPAAIEFIVKQWQLSPRVAEGSYDLMVKTFSPDGTAPERMVRNLVEEVRRAQKMDREISVSDVVDFSFVREALRRSAIP